MSMVGSVRVLALLGILTMPEIGGAQVITLRADSARRTIAPSSKLAVPVIIDLSVAAGTNLASISTGVAFGTNRLTFDSVRTASFGSLTSNIANAATGALTLGVFDATGTTTSQTLATMYFTASATTGGTGIAFSPTAAGTDVGSNIFAMMRSRAMDVCVAPSGKWGDVNGDSVATPLGDGTVNIIDAQQIARNSVGLTVANRPGLVARGDVTADGTVNIIDAQQIARFSVGMSSAARISTSVFTAPAVASVGLVPSATQNLAIGQSVRIAATPRDAASADLTGCSSVTWSSSNPMAATVGTDGTVTGVADGTSIIRATSSDNVGVTASVSVVVGAGAGSLGIGLALDQFALIPAGTFQMGSNIYPGSNETPVHSVTISRAFYLQKTETTQGQWQAVMGSNPSYFSSCGATCPVEQLSKNDVQAFLQTLNAQTPGVTYRLPTEAEWEYAARAGTTGETYGALDDIAWYVTNAGLTTHAVAGKQANAWGLYDMIGNVFEWVSDWYAPYPGAAVTDPTGPATGSDLVLRGGSIEHNSNARAAYRGATNGLTYRGRNFGLRLVRTPAVATVTVAPSTTSVAIGGTQQFTATLKDGGDTTRTDRAIVWSSSNAAIATVGASSGLVTGVAAGTATITATSEGKTGTASITVAAVPRAALALTSSARHTCFRTNAGAAYCWGNNYRGQIGDGTTTADPQNGRPTPTPVLGGLVFSALATGEAHSCGVTTAGLAYCWGSNDFGRLGDGSATSSLTPVQVQGGRSFVSLASGAAHTCGLTAAGAAYCWGYNNAGQLGDATTVDRSAPTLVQGGYSFVSLTAGGYHTCGVTTSGAAYCWGYNGFGQLGDGTIADHSSPVAVSGGIVFASLTTGDHHTCGRTSAGTAYCWGFNSYGGLGDASVTAKSAPVAVQGGYAFSVLTAGGYHTCGVTSGGTTYCWGYDSNGQLGIGELTDRYIPTAVVAAPAFITVSAGVYFTCGMTNTDAVACWGDNRFGQLGDGTFTNRNAAIYVNWSSPTPPPSVPATPSVGSATANSLTVSWSAVAGATSYKLYKANAAAGSYAEVSASATSPYVDSGLAASTTFYYRVSACNASACSAQSSEGSGTTLVGSGGPVAPAVPSAPTVGVATASSLTVSWSTVSGATSYTLYRATSATGTYVEVSASATSPYVDGGLSPSTTYFYKLIACNATGCSVQSAEGTGTTLVAGVAPAAPGAPTVASATSNSLTVSWSAVSGATSYTLYRATSATGTYELVSATASSPYVDTGLSATTTYFYKVSACNATGCSVQSSEGSGTTSAGGGAVPSVPGAPAVPSATVSSLLVTWSTVSGATTYVLYRSTSATGTYAQVSASATSPYVDGGLAASTTYFYKVSACNTAGCSVQSSEGSGTTAAAIPGVPSAPTVGSATSSTLTVRWNAVSGAAWYTLARATSAAGTYTQVSVVDVTAYTDAGLAASTTFYYKIAACNVTGCSVPSSAGTGTTLAVSVAAVNSVTVAPSPAAVSVAATLTLQATLRDASSNVLTQRLVVWTSASNAIATVNAAGVVTGVSEGTTTITATSEGKFGVATLTVYSRLTPVLYFDAKLDNGTTTPVWIEVLQPNGGAKIATTDTTWIVIHGRCNSAATPEMQLVAAAIKAKRPRDQVLLLDWESGAMEQTFSPCWLGSRGEKWIEPVGRAAATALAAYGFTDASRTVNLVGHSWGAYVADKLASGLGGGVNLIIALDPAKDDPTNGSFEPSMTDFFAHSRYSVAFHSSDWGDMATPANAREAFAVGFVQTFGSADQVDRHSWIREMFASMVLGPGGVSALFTLDRLLAHTIGPWQLDRYKADDAFQNAVSFPTRIYEGVIESVQDARTPRSIRYVDGSGTEQVVYQPTLVLNASPAILQTSDWGQTVTYTLTVTDLAGAPVQGATVGFSDYLMAVSASTALTNANGVTTYTTTVPSGKANGAYDVVFVKANKAGYNSSSSQTRQVNVQHVQQTLSLGVTPTAVQIRDWGGAVQYTVTVTDAQGAPVSGATVGMSDYVMALSPVPLVTNANGTTTYTTTVASGTANATYDVVFLFASKSGYTNSGSQTRQVSVQHASTGSIYAQLRGITGALAGQAGARYRLYANGTLIRTVSATNPAVLADLPAGTYLLEGYYTGTFFGEEFWTSSQVTVTAGQQITATLTRDYPYAADIVIKNHASGAIIVSGQSVPSGTTLRAEVTVRNNVPGTAMNTTVRFLMDRDRAATYDKDQPLAQTVGGSGGASVYTFTYTPTAAGQLYYAAEVVTTMPAGGTVRTDSWTWTSSAVIGTTSALELLSNGGFESGGANWVTNGSAYVTTSLPNPHLPGIGYAYLGADAAGTKIDNTTGSLYQTITIPAVVSGATLRFWYRITTDETTTTTAYDVLTVTVKNTSGTTLGTIATISNLNANASYSQATYDLRAYIGQTIRISFAMTSDVGNPTVFRIDDVSLTAP